MTTHRRATPRDAIRLFELRRKSILVLASQGMPGAEVEAWSANLTVAGMEQKIHALEIWVAEIDGRAVGWGAIRGDRLEGLYTDPDFANRGIATELLGKLESLMHTRGICRISAEASSNAERFYLRRGYEPAGPRHGEAREVAKQLKHVSPAWP